MRPKTYEAVAAGAGRRLVLALLLALTSACHLAIDPSRHVCDEPCDAGVDAAADSAVDGARPDADVPDATAPDADAMPDGGPPDGMVGMCVVDSQCDDSMFCNGVEVCDPGNLAADARGCAPSDPVDCDDGADCSFDSCDEDLDSCVNVGPDLDGDDFYDAECASVGGEPLGDDCDDGDPNRHPGAAELCDGLDQDCDGAVDEGADASSCAPVTRGEPMCVEGCVVGSCEIPFLDCNGDYDDGCESDTDSNPVHCGSCETLCSDGTCHSGGCGLAASDVAGAHNIACVLRPDTSVWCWGEAMGSTRDELVDIPEAFGAVDIDAEHNQICAALGDGTARCWGRTELSGTVPYFPETPMMPAGLTDAIAVQVAMRNACALRDTGGVSCWGSGEGGVLGPGISGADERTTAVSIAGISGAVQLAGSWRNMCARNDMSEVRCWGAMINGLGDSLGTTSSDTPVLVAAPAAIDVAVSRNHGCVVTTGGEVHCWGRNTEGQLGDGTTVARGTPVRAHSITDGLSLSLQDNITCVVRAGGLVSCWGINNGRFADGTFANSSTPVDAIMSGTVARLDIGLSAGFAVTGAGELLSWAGDDWYRRRTTANLLGRYATGTVD